MKMPTALSEKPKPNQKFFYQMESEELSCNQDMDNKDKR